MLNFLHHPLYQNKSQMYKNVHLNNDKSIRRKILMLLPSWTGEIFLPLNAKSKHN